MAIAWGTQNESETRDLVSYGNFAKMKRPEGQRADVRNDLHGAFFD